MRVAIISDIHGNMEAFEAVLSDINGMGIDRRVCLGDIVGYGADPVECIEKVRELGIDSVLGNHDSAAVGGTPIDYFNQYARQAVLWTADELGEEENSYIKGLPLKLDYEGFTAVHSSLSRPDEWEYIMDPIAARRCFAKLKDQICFIGHSHVPVVFREEDGVGYSSAGEISIESGIRYIINVGSIGQPRDGDPRAGYGIYDTVEKRVEIRRVAYDVGKAQDKIVSAGLPAFLASRLGVGH